MSLIDRIAEWKKIDPSQRIDPDVAMLVLD